MKIVCWRLHSNPSCVSQVKEVEEDLEIEQEEVETVNREKVEMNQNLRRNISRILAI